MDERIETIMEIDCHSVKEKLAAAGDCLLLDCREQSEWDTVHIHGALLIPMSELRDRVSELDAYRDAEIMVYCHHGARSLQVAGWLRQQGFSNTLSMKGGIDHWAQEIDTALPRY
jgi:rhodanese-related sulfurtransferase